MPCKSLIAGDIQLGDETFQGVAIDQNSEEPDLFPDRLVKISKVDPDQANFELLPKKQ